MITELDSRIAALTNDEAIQASAYLAECLRQQLQAAFHAPVTIDDNQAAGMLCTAFPEAAGELQGVRPGADDQFRAQAARQFLAVCAEEPQYAGYVQDAIDQLVFKCEPLTLMAVAAGIVFLMQLKFKANVTVHTKTVDGTFEIGKNPTSEGLLKKILSIGSLK